MNLSISKEYYYLECKMNEKKMKLAQLFAFRTNSIWSFLAWVVNVP